MAVYFIRDSITGLIKIGHSADAWHRFYTIQTHTPGKVEMLALEEGGVARERELHKTFADLRERGEWFRPGFALTKHIGTLPPAAPARASASRAFWNGMNDVELSDASGVCRSMLSHIRTGQRRPSPEVAIVLQRLTGVSAIKLIFGDLAGEAA